MKARPSAHRPIDRRVARTRNALIDALLELIAEKGYDRTSVNDILDRADVGRATFYSHFYNKDDLLVHRMTIFRLNVDGCMRDGKFVQMPDVTALFEHVAHMHDVVTALSGTEGLDAGLAVARRDLQQSFLGLFGRRSDSAETNGRSAEFLAQFFTGALLNLLLWWHREGMPETPETMNRWFSQLGERVLDH